MRLEYPVWILDGKYDSSDSTSSCDTTTAALLDDFYELNNERRDFHAHPSPVEDIIDPDLLIYRPQTADAEREEEMSLRDQYQWIPSDFRVNRNEVHIETPICHLPMNEKYENTYRNIEIIFEKLVPMFRKIMSFNENGDTRLQVVVKVQSYNIKPGMKYSGRWHTEGRTENIQAVGVYYLYIDDELEGGALKFRPAVSPKPYYVKEANRYLMPETDTAVVFSNDIPHRFCSIRNTTSNLLRRTFLNFFIVDRQSPIPTNELCVNNLPLVSYDQCLNLLKSITLNEAQHLPDLVIERILLYLTKYMWQTEIDAKDFRQRVRQEMVKQRAGWSGIDYGNFGDVKFINKPKEWSEMDDSARDYYSKYLSHTESEQSLE
ncbi:unnamed protein product [Didymodactylos carnosus]|uniref:DUF4246 domain-containing protein n=1 Tax=Didymodactylos carnosus TaxID=1234261 RepID=A0A815VRC1_9BILA|nr:unnamed protein product [Didymodactylos carnosus]CAF4396140.1 unnamed protein product [Didymodactylos carnosus]